MNSIPKVSAIIPVYNEIQYISSCLESLINNDYPKDNLEILVVEGGSNDGTIKVIKQFEKNYGYIYYIKNPQKTVPFALNTGIKTATGDYILIIGAHSEYPENYISGLIRASLELDADNVGGMLINLPADNRNKSLAIALALASPFGVGNAYFRIGSGKIRKVDTVTFGCYKKNIFSKIGYFSEDLVRNQDDEFNARLLKNGGTIYLIPDIKIKYIVRSSIKKTARMFFQYGIFKPLVNKKIGRISTLRQLFPLFFIIYLLLLIISIFIFSAKQWIVMLFPLILYVIMNILFSLKSALSAGKPGVFFYLIYIFFIIHISYGLGYLRGIIIFLIIKRKKIEVQTNR